ncbi:MAG: glutamate transport system permease protein [Cryptosporangiaceae bacterium]|nr:glutamate transport system permease protein [Cryptosporangiaceae bacterium]
MSSQVLYDSPGPRTRRYTLIGSLVFGALALAGLYAFVYRPLAANNQFSADLWGPLADPSNENFPLVWDRIRTGFANTLAAAALAIAASLIIGTALGVLRFRLAAVVAAPRPRTASARWWAVRTAVWVLNVVTRVFVEFFRGLPVVLTIFFTARILPEYGVDLPTRYFLVIGLALYNSVIIGEILRSGMANLPRGQREAAEAIGLSGTQTVLSILLPQAFRIMLPALISQVVVVLKDTSLGFIISYEEALQVASQIIQVLHNPIQVYAVIAAIYIALNYTLSRLATYAQRRIARGRKSPPGAVVPDVLVPSRLGGAGEGPL